MSNGNESACPQCGSKDLFWRVTPEHRGGIPDGRLCLNEVSVIAYLGCNFCSETIKVIDEGQIEERLKGG